jgi:Ser/Thr protein kinase RdoA (MazF antagonist)
MPPSRRASDPTPAALPVTHSLLSPAALVEHVLSGYDVGRVLHCRLHMHNLNDTYFVWTDGGRYVLRVSRAGWRTDEQIRAELDAIERIAPRVSHGVAVARPVRTRAGERLQGVQAPEGRRLVVLFAHAAGKENVQGDAGASARFRPRGSTRAGATATSTAATPPSPGTR